MVKESSPIFQGLKLVDLKEMGIRRFLDALGKLPALPGLQLPKIVQVGFIINDFKLAVKEYSRFFGVTTWYYFDFATADNLIQYNGKMIAVSLGVGMCYVGNLQVEFIEVKGGDESMYSEHLRQYGESLHHVGYVMRDVKGALKEMEARGFKIILKAIVKSGKAKSRFGFIDTVKSVGVVIEFMEPIYDGIHVGFDEIALKLGHFLGANKKIQVS